MSDVEKDLLALRDKKELLNSQLENARLEAQKVGNDNGKLQVQKGLKRVELKAQELVLKEKELQQKSKKIETQEQELGLKQLQIKKELTKIEQQEKEIDLKKPQIKKELTKIEQQKLISQQESSVIKVKTIETKNRNHSDWTRNKGKI